MTRIAHVGAAINSETQSLYENDRWHFDVIFRWLCNRGDDYDCLYHENRIDDFIDLNKGRDFLVEDQEYDIVVLHMIYSPPHRCCMSTGSCSPFRVSHLHHPAVWRNRLISTGAKYIFTFGDIDEVSGEYLGGIPGYVGPLDIDDMTQVYFSESLKRSQ